MPCREQARLMLERIIECLEITREGELIGYVIWFSGGWDVYRIALAPDGNVQKKEDAVDLV